MTEKVNVQTGELVTVEQPVEFLPVALGEMQNMIEYTEKFIKSVLKRGTDYGMIPGTKKDSMYKAGAEKLCFGFGLEPEYEIVSSTDEPFKEWTYKKYNKSKRVHEDQSARGYYQFTVSCRLVHRASGMTWGVGLGSCDSTERGRETSPANTILKMAQKRAYVGITLNATFTSDRFTADVEDYRGDQAVKSSSHREPDPDPKPTADEIEIGKLSNLTQAELIQKVNNLVDKYSTATDSISETSDMLDRAVAAKVLGSLDYAECTELQLATFSVMLKKKIAKVTR